jgi:hypothetical protein
MQDRKDSLATWYLAPVPNSHISNLNKALHFKSIYSPSVGESSYWAKRSSIVTSSLRHFVTPFLLS